MRRDGRPRRRQDHGAVPRRFPEPRRSRAARHRTRRCHRPPQRRKTPRPSHRELYRSKTARRCRFKGNRPSRAPARRLVRSHRKSISSRPWRLSPSNDPPARPFRRSAQYSPPANFEVDEVNIGITRKVPDDASLLIAVSPQSQFTPSNRSCSPVPERAAAGSYFSFRPDSPRSPRRPAVRWGVVADNDYNLRHRRPTIHGGRRLDHRALRPASDHADADR